MKLSRHPLIAIAGLAGHSWFLGHWFRHLARWAGRLAPGARGRTADLLRRAAQREGFESYDQLVCSRAPGTHSATLQGEFIGSGYFGFSFHFAFVTGLFFPEFLRQAMQNPALFYAQEVTLSALIALAITYFMIVGHMGALAVAAYRTNNLSEHVEQLWDERLKGGRGQRLSFLFSFLAIPFGRFPGILKHGMSYKLDGEAPLEVSAAGPRAWDRIVARFAWGTAVPLLVLAILSSTGRIPPVPAAVEWLTRIVVPVAFVSTMGTYLTGRGAYRTYVAEKLFSRKKSSALERQFDLSDLKRALAQGDGA